MAILNMDIMGQVDELQDEHRCWQKRNLELGSHTF